MENLLQGIQGVCVYIDDILISGRTDEEHLEHLDEVICRLAEAGMRLKKRKCAYLLSAVDYLGHMINAEDLRTSDSKVAGIVKAPAPRNVSELRSFLGLVNYYGKFLPDLANTLTLVCIAAKEKEVVMGCQRRGSLPSSEKVATVVSRTGSFRPQPTSHSVLRCVSVWVGSGVIPQDAEWRGKTCGICISYTDSY